MTEKDGNWRRRAGDSRSPSVCVSMEFLPYIVICIRILRKYMNFYDVCWVKSWRQQPINKKK